MSNTLCFYSFNLVYKRKKLLYILVAAFFLILLKATFKLSQQYSINVIVYPEADALKNWTNFYMFAIITAIYILIFPLVVLASELVENFILTDAFTYWYKTFLSYRYMDWSRIIGGDLYSIIFRRAKGISKYHKELILGIVDNTCYIILGIVRMLLLHGFQSYFITAFALLTLFPTILSSLSLLRTRVLRKSNEAYDVAERMLKDIFLNYEMIRTYNMTEDAMIKYMDSLKGWYFWFLVSWMLETAIDIIYRVFKLLLIVLLFERAERAISNRRHVVDQMKIFNSLMKRLHSLTGSFKSTIENRENVIHSKLENLVILQKDKVFQKSNFTTNLTISNMKKLYDGNLIFKNVNVTINKGEKIAITGINGSGKSSFTKSLFGLEPFSGQILIDGINIEYISDADITHLMSYVPQDPEIFEASLYENLTAFSDELQKEDVILQLASVGMHEEFKAIGYDTMLVEKGKNITSVQRQKICFCRAILRNTPIIVFDEVTSEMNSDHEKKIVNMIIETMKDRTVIMIIHNLDLLQRFDRVLVFNNKTVSKCLPYAELLAEDIEFKEYCSLKL
ncbi:hypothetical protein GINT2_000904 [Glugoides intestinalis]